MTGRVQVVVATTEGPSTVLRVTPEDPALRSVVCLGRGTTVLPISRAYDAFVRAPTGVVERAVGHRSFRTDVSAPIDDGDSWQLGLYLAHRLKATGRLAEDGEPADLVLWATGAVDGDLAVGPVAQVDEKLRRSAGLFAAEAGRMLVVVPADRADALADLPVGVRSRAAGTVAEILGEIGLGPPPRPARSRRLRWSLAGLAAAAVVAGAVALVPRPQVLPAGRVPATPEVAVAPPAVAPPAVVPPTVVPPTVVAPTVVPPAFDPVAVELAVLEARPQDGAACGAGERLVAVDPGRPTAPGVCAVVVRATNGGTGAGFVWLVVLAEGSFREYAAGSRSAEASVGPLAPGAAVEARLAAPSWVRRPVGFQALMVLADREHGQVTRALAAADTLTAGDFDRLTGQFRDLGLDVRTLRHSVQPRP